MAPSKNGFGFGLGLGGLLLLAVAPWIVAGLRPIPYFVEAPLWLSRVASLGLQIGLSGLIAGWLAYEATRSVTRRLARVALMTLIVFLTTAGLAMLFPLFAQAYAVRILMFYLLALPLPSLVAVPVWATLYLWLIGSSHGRTVY